MNAWLPNVTKEIMQSYMSKTLPNIISPLHFIGQSPVTEHVLSSSSVLIVQPGLSYDLIEDVLEIPKGFFQLFIREETSVGSYLQWGMDWLTRQSRRRRFM